MTKNNWQAPHYLRGTGKVIIPTSDFTQGVESSYLCKAGLSWQDGGEKIKAAFCVQPWSSHPAESL